MDSAPLEMIRSIKGECQAWFTANASHTELQSQISMPQVLSLESV